MATVPAFIPALSLVLLQAPIVCPNHKCPATCAIVTAATACCAESCIACRLCVISKECSCSSENHQQNNCATQAEHEKGWSCAAYLLQRFLHSTLDCFPTTAGSAQFCLLCCQPEPVPESLPARPPSLTRRCPCSLPVWSGQSIHMVCRTYSSPRHSISPTPLRGTERCDPSQI